MTLDQLQASAELVRVRRRLLALPRTPAAITQRLHLVQQANQILAELKAGTDHNQPR